MNTTQLECFLAVANFLNFSRAAEQLHITQPAVSHQIGSLEDELGTKLFFRTSKSVRLTQAGHLFTQYAGEILKLSRLSAARLKEWQEELPQRLGIGCRNFVELRLLRPALEQLRLRMPQLLPVLRMIPFAAADNLLEDGDLQVLLTLRQSLPKKAAYRELARCSLACLCAPDHPFASCETLTVDQLQQSGRIAACPPSIYPPDLFSHQSRILSGRQTHQVLFCDSLEIVYTLVESGYAFAVLPDLPFARSEGLRYIPISGIPPLSFGAAYDPGQTNPALRTFLDILEATLAEGVAGLPEPCYHKDSKGG